MIVYLLLAVSLGVSLAYTLLRNSFCRHLPHVRGAMFAYNAAFSAVSSLCMLVYTLLTHGTFNISVILWGIFFGLLTAAAALFNMKAFETGPLSYTSLISTSSMMIPALSGVLFFDEKIGILKWVGVALMLVSVVLSLDFTPTSKDKRRKRQKSGNTEWFIWSMLLFFSCGGVGVMQKFFRATPDGNETGAFLTVAFAVAALSTAAAIPLSPRSGNTETGKTVSLFTDRGFILNIIISGVFIATANLINLYLSGAMDSMIFFPIVNGGGLMLCMIAALVFLRERLSRRQAVGIAVGCISVALLCIGPL